MLLPWQQTPLPLLVTKETLVYQCVYLCDFSCHLNSWAQARSLQWISFTDNGLLRHSRFKWLNLYNLSSFHGVENSLNFLSDLGLTVTMTIQICALLLARPTISVNASVWVCVFYWEATIERRLSSLTCCTKALHHPVHLGNIKETQNTQNQPGPRLTEDEWINESGSNVWLKACLIEAVLLISSLIQHLWWGGLIKSALRYISNFKQ